MPVASAASLSTLPVEVWLRLPSATLPATDISFCPGADAKVALQLTQSRLLHRANPGFLFLQISPRPKSPKARSDSVATREPASQTVPSLTIRDAHPRIQTISTDHPEEEFCPLAVQKATGGTRWGCSLR